VSGAAPVASSRAPPSWQIDCMLRSAGHGADAPAGLLPSFSPGAGGDYGGFAAMRERLAGGPRGLGCGSRAQHRLWGTLATGACAALLVSQTLSDMGGIVCCAKALAGYALQSAHRHDQFPILSEMPFLTV
jgi:hypothetical protein